MKADKPRLGSFLSFFFLGFLALPSALSFGAAFALLCLAAFGGFSGLESELGMEADGFGFLACGNTLLMPTLPGNRSMLPRYNPQ